MKNSVKRIFIMMLACMLVFSAVSVNNSINAEAAAKVTKIKLSKKSLTVNVGSSKKLTASLSPAKAKKSKVTWTSSNKKVAIVKNGKVTGVSVGTATITAKAGGKKASCKVKVTLSGKTQKALQAYQEFLGAEKVCGYAQSEVKFILTFINGDEIPELIIMDKAGITAKEIVYYDKGQVKSMGYAYHSFIGYYPQRGMVRAYWIYANIHGYGMEADRYVQIAKSGEVSTLGEKARYFSEDERDSFEYTWKEKNVSKTKFSNLLKKTVGTKFVKFKGGFDNTEQNRKRLKKLITM